METLIGKVRWKVLENGCWQAFSRQKQCSGGKMLYGSPLGNVAAENRRVLVLVFWVVFLAQCFCCPNQ